MDKRLYNTPSMESVEIRTQGVLMVSDEVADPFVDPKLPAPKKVF